MARIPEDEVERLKREVSVERLAEARGHQADTGMEPTCWASAPSTTTATRRWSSLRRRISGTAWARATRAGRPSTG